MHFRYFLVLIVLICPQFSGYGQSDNYTVEKASFSSNRNDEFSPVYYGDQIVFSTNRHSASVSKYTDNQNSSLIKIYSARKGPRNNWKKPRPFSKNLKTRYNDGPVTFNSSEDTIYYSRNMRDDSRISKLTGGRNNLGIFYAVRQGNDWTRIREMRINNEYYNISTPFLSEDGKTLYFASDMPGFGGSDLYYSKWNNGYWNNPVNMGPVINTKGNEAYPSVNKAGEFFFASDGHPGLGGKDIFFSRLEDSVWITPIRLGTPINSEYDDFGIITDTLMSEGFFSSNRDKSIDIYHFKTIVPQIFYNDIQKEHPYCMKFEKNGMADVDTVKLKYVWDFGDGNSAVGANVNHCFPGPGKYKVKLDIFDRATGSLFFSELEYEIELNNYEGPFIKSQDFCIAGDSIIFSGDESYLPGYNIVNYSWDFGDGAGENGDRIFHSFKSSGEYMVNMVLTLRSDSTGAIHKDGSSKRITVLNDANDAKMFTDKLSKSESVFSDIHTSDNIIVKTVYSAQNAINDDAMFEVELLSSNTRIDLNGQLFRDISRRYDINEIYNKQTGLYTYVTGQQINLMDTYIEFRHIAEEGFKDAKVRIKVLDNPASKEIYKLIKIFGNHTDTYFDGNSRLTSSAYLLLDQIVVVLNKYPQVKLEVDVHTDTRGGAAEKLRLSQKYAQIISDYLKNKGISPIRLIARGIGELRPITAENTEMDRSKNRRVDFVIVND